MQLRKITTSLITFLCTLGVQTSFTQEVNAFPNWQKGDKRLVKNYTSIVSTMSGDTIMSKSSNSRDTIEVIEANESEYFIQYRYASTERDNGELLGLELDSLKEMAPFLLLMKGFTQSMEMSMKETDVTYELAKTGRAVSVVAFDDLFQKLQDAVVLALVNFFTELEKWDGMDKVPKLDESQIRAMMLNMKDQANEQMLNYVNYLNQAYFELSYDISKEVSTKAVVTEYNIIRYGKIEINAQVNTEVIEKSGETLTVKVSTTLDSDEFKKTLENRFESDSLTSIEIVKDEKIIQFDPQTFWIQDYQEELTMKVDDIEVIKFSRKTFEEIK